jgi:hypothetical protein
MPDLAYFSDGSADGVPPYVGYEYEGRTYDSRVPADLEVLEKKIGRPLRGLFEERSPAELDFTLWERVTSYLWLPLFWPLDWLQRRLAARHEVDRRARVDALREGAIPWSSIS